MSLDFPVVLCFGCISGVRLEENENGCLITGCVCEEYENEATKLCASPFVAAGEDGGADVAAGSKVVGAGDTRFSLLLLGITSLSVVLLDLW